MKHTISRFLCVVTLLAIAALTAATACSGKSKQRVVIKGSTTVLPIVQKAAEEYRRENRSVIVSVTGDGSGNGIKALIDGTADIATSSREMKPEEREKAKSKNITAGEIVVAYDMIIPIVHPANPVTNLSTAQLKAIYDGSLKNWKDLGGPDETIVVISRDTSSGTYEVWEERIMNKTRVRPDALLQASNGAITSTVAGNKKAIGYVGFGYLGKSVKALSVNGVIGTIDKGKSGVFPISRKLFIYVNEVSIRPPVRAFIDYLLSDKGQALVRSLGFIPIK